jgi:hypothetical protein
MFLRTVLQLLVTANFVLLPILVMEAKRSSETAFLTRATRHDITEDRIRHSSSLVENLGEMSGFQFIRKLIKPQSQNVSCQAERK